MATCTVILAFVLLAVATVVSVISVGSPYWTVFGDGDTYMGFWEICHQGNCSGLYYNDLRDPVKAASLFFLFAVIACIIALVFGITTLCCQSCRGSYRCNQTITGILIAANIAMIIAVILYAADVHNHKYGFIGYILGPKLGWSFFMGLAATVCSLLSFILYLCEGCTIITQRAHYVPLT